MGQFIIVLLRKLSLMNYTALGKCKEFSLALKHATSCSLINNCGADLIIGAKSDPKDKVGISSVGKI